MGGRKEKETQKGDGEIHEAKLKRGRERKGTHPSLSSGRKGILSVSERSREKRESLVPTTRSILKKKKID